MVKQTLPLIKQEEEFKDLLSIVIDYFQRLDQEHEETELKRLLDKRSHFLPDRPFDPKDSDLASLVHLLKLK